MMSLSAIQARYEMSFLGFIGWHEEGDDLSIRHSGRR